MGVLFRRGERMVNFAVSVAIAIVYYIFLLAGEPLGKQGKIPPFWAMWSANIFFAVLTVLLFWTIFAEKPPLIPSRWSGWIRERIPMVFRRLRRS
jgi:O-antigen/teichoic acid export membrane protein